MSTEATTEHKAVSLSAWKKAALHYPLLPSNVRVGIKIPDIAALIEAGQIPQDLLKAALGIAKEAAQADVDKVPTVEEMTQSAAEEVAFTALLVQHTVVEPKLTASEVADLPTEDKQFLVALATRQRDVDVEGEHIVGLMKSEKYRRFRRVGEFDTALEGL